MHNTPFNACKIALFCVIGLVTLSHATAQMTVQQDAPRAPEKKKDSIDFLFRVSPAILSAATSVDMYTTVHGLDHPTVAYRADGTVLTYYYIREEGWARCFGDRSSFAATTANVALNNAVTMASRRLYARGGRWRIAATALVLAKAGANFAGGVQNIRLLSGIDGQIRRSTHYQGEILWSWPQRLH